MVYCEKMPPSQGEMHPRWTEQYSVTNCTNSMVKCLHDWHSDIQYQTAPVPCEMPPRLTQQDSMTNYPHPRMNCLQDGQSNIQWWTALIVIKWFVSEICKLFCLQWGHFASGMTKLSQNGGGGIKTGGPLSFSAGRGSLPGGIVSCRQCVCFLERRVERRGCLICILWEQTCRTSYKNSLHVLPKWCAHPTRVNGTTQCNFGRLCSTSCQF